MLMLVIPFVNKRAFCWTRGKGVARIAETARFLGHEPYKANAFQIVVMCEILTDDAPGARIWSRNCSEPGIQLLASLSYKQVYNEGG